MTKVQSSYSYRKWGVGLGVLAAFGLSAYLALKPTKKNIIPPSTQPAAKVLEPKPLKTLEKAVQLFETMKRAKLANFDGGVELKPRVEPSEEASQKHKPANDLKQLFAELNDVPIPPSEVNGRSIETNTEGVCYMPFIFSEEYGHKEYELIIGGKSIGYIYLRREKDPFDHLKSQVFYGVLDTQGNLMGYRQKSIFMSSWLKFITRGGEEAKFFEDGSSKSHFIYRDGNLENPIGKVNEDTGEIMDLEREVIGKLDKQAFYLLIESIPKCEGTESKITTFLKFNSEAELERFLGGIKRSIGSDWEKLAKKPQAEENNQEED